MVDRRLETLALKHDLSMDLLGEYHGLFREHNIPVSLRTRKTGRARRIVMVSTHGYWGDPPPAGVPDTGGQTYYVLEVSKAWARQGRDGLRAGNGEEARYPPVADVVLVDLTYGLALKNVTLKVFLESDYLRRIAAVKERNLSRDPDQDFAFIQKVLEVEHRLIQGMKEEADMIVTSDYEARPR